MRIALTDENGNIRPIDVDETTEFEMLQVLINVELSIPKDQQMITHDELGEIATTSTCLSLRYVTHTTLTNISTEEASTLKELNIKDGFVLLVKRKRVNSNSRVVQTGPPSAGEDFRGLKIEDIPIGCDPLRYRAIILANPGELKRLRFMNKELAEAIEDSDPSKVREVMMKQEFASAMRRTEADLVRRNLRQRLMDNPMDIEAQRQLEHIIQQENIQQNMNLALEHSPESFTHVTMLYINCEVNGVPVKAFVDSGAQITVMSESCARKCNIMHLVDTRFAGTLTGVGSARMIGCVHMARLKIGSCFFPCKFNVMENQNHTGHEFLFGLDMLRRHQCCIDLKRNRLCLGEGEEVRFLKESEISDGEAFGRTDGGSGGSQKKRRRDDADDETSKTNDLAPTSAPTTATTTTTTTAETTTAATTTTTTSSTSISLADLDFAMSNAKRDS